jgi:hypothetical protein
VDDAASKVDLDEPDNDDLLCRYLSPEKFLWFIGEKKFHLSRPDEFDDQAECALHVDYQIAIERNLGSFVERFCGPLTGSPERQKTFLTGIRGEWRKFERARRNDWLISCWTRITQHYDDKLLSFKYTGGRFGVGITARYGALKRLFEKAARFDRGRELWAGYVNYKPTVMKAAPFNKRPGFKSESEVRFAVRALPWVETDVPAGPLKQFGLRLSTDSPPHHHEAVLQLWRKAGGDVDNIHIT